MNFLNDYDSSSDSECDETINKTVTHNLKNSSNNFNDNVNSPTTDSKLLSKNVIIDETSSKPDSKKNTIISSFSIGSFDKFSGKTHDDILNNAKLYCLNDTTSDPLKEKQNVVNDENEDENEDEDEDEDEIKKSMTSILARYKQNTENKSKTVIPISAADRLISVADRIEPFSSDVEPSVTINTDHSAKSSSENKLDESVINSLLVNSSDKLNKKMMKELETATIINISQEDLTKLNQHELIEAALDQQFNAGRINTTIASTVWDSAKGEEVTVGGVPGAKKRKYHITDLASKAEQAQREMDMMKARNAMYNRLR